MQRRFIAFYDALIFAIIAGVMLTVALRIFVLGNFSDSAWRNQNWDLIVIFAICVAVPFTLMFCLQKMTIDLSSDKVEIFYLVNYKKNAKDLRSNWIIYPSQVINVSVVNLSKEEKRKYTSAKFIFSKYLKVELEGGFEKYVYVSHYSNTQIKSIIRMLTYNK